MPDAKNAGHPPDRPAWFRDLAQYERPDTRVALRQMLLTVIPMLGLLALMLYTVLHGFPYWSTLLLVLPTTALLIRSFIFLHDASHGSYFPSPRANAVLGFLVGVLILTPYHEWRWAHLYHHATFANLDRRGVGDIKLITVAEYQAAPWPRRLSYWIYRHPLVLFTVGPTILFAVIQRLPIRSAPASEHPAVWLSNAAMLAMVTGADLTVGLRAFLLVMAPIWVIAWTTGVWLFYVQHQFQGVYWARQEEWDFLRAALEGSSHYKLPRLLQWCTGNIGLHHLHHMRPRIPNYRLQEAYDATPAIHVPPVTLRTSLDALWSNLYDEEAHRMVSFHEAARARGQ